MTQQQMEGLARLSQLLAEEPGQLAAFLVEQHPVDLAEWLEELTDDQRIQIFEFLDSETAALVLGELDPETQAVLVAGLGKEKAGDIIEEMSDDDVADLLAELTPDQRGQILGELEAEDAQDVRELLEHDPDTAGGLMTTDYITVLAEMTAEQAIEHLRRVGPEAETFYYVYVVDTAERLVGVISLRELIIAQPPTLVRDIMRSKVVSVRAGQDQEEVARAVSKYDLLAIPVVDHEQRLVGMVTVDDVLDVIEAEATEDALRMSAVTPDEEDPSATNFTASIWRLAKPRLPWLIALLFLEIASGQVIDHFQTQFSPAMLAMLTIFITTMAGEAGNAATQALAVVVRSLATGEIGSQDIFRVVWRELRVGVTVGIIAGVVLAGMALAWQRNLQLALIVGLAIALNITVAKVLGAFFPILVNRLGFDPAVASGPLITSITDVTSMLTYFGLATLILTRFGA